MKLFKKVSVFTMLLVMSILFLAPTSAKAATVGQTLVSPEEGWQRIDDTDSNIIYTGSWLNTISDTKRWESFAKYCNGGSVSTITFKFYGTKLRLIGEAASNKANNNIIIIDGVNYTFNEYSSSGTGIYRALVFEKSGLDLGLHTIVIKSSSAMTASQNIVFDAIDIDSTGYIVPFSQTSNLSATAGDSSVNLTWLASEGGTSYNIKRATTPGGPYTTIATVAECAYIDTNVTNETTYYYVVSAIDTNIESNNSNEVLATPTAIIIGNSAILEITMTNGGIKTYDLTFAELDSFLSWYDNRSEGNGKSYYVFTKKNDIRPYLSKKEYISFDKISSFEVREYVE